MVGQAFACNADALSPSSLRYGVRILIQRLSSFHPFLYKVPDSARRRTAADGPAGCSLGGRKSA